MITIGTVVAVAGIIFAAAALQRAVGFGFALLAVPLLAFVVPTKSAVVIVFLNGTVTCAWLAIRLRRYTEWTITRRLGVGAVAGAPVGVIILSVTSAATLPPGSWRDDLLGCRLDHRPVSDGVPGTGRAASFDNLCNGLRERGHQYLAGDQRTAARL